MTGRRYSAGDGVSRLSADDKSREYLWALALGRHGSDLTVPTADDLRRWFDADAEPTGTLRAERLG